MGGLTEFAIDLMRDLFDRWGYLVVFLGTMTENLLFLGVVIPGALVLLLAGISAEDRLLDLRWALALGVLGTSLGDTLSYVAGRFGWRRALRHAEDLPLMGTVRSALLRRSGLFVLSYHFLGYTRVLGPITAGALRLPFKRWFIFDLMGAMLWVSAYVFGGYLLARAGLSFEEMREHAGKLDRVLLVLSIAGAGIALLYLRRRQRNHARNTAAPEPAGTEPEPVADEQAAGGPRG